jgi:hypothetical protein
MQFVRGTVGALIRVGEFALADFVNGILARVTLSFPKISSGLDSLVRQNHCIIGYDPADITPVTMAKWSHGATDWYSAP